MHNKLMPAVTVWNEGIWRHDLGAASKWLFKNEKPRERHGDKFHHQPLFYVYMILGLNNASKNFTCLSMLYFLKWCGPLDYLSKNADSTHYTQSFVSKPLADGAWETYFNKVLGWVRSRLQLTALTLHITTGYSVIHTVRNIASLD